MFPADLPRARGARPDTSRRVAHARGAREHAAWGRSPGRRRQLRARRVHRREARAEDEREGAARELGDHLGSTTVVLDQATGELVEASSYQAYGAAEADYRPDRWNDFREDYRFTGKEEDVEVGLTYFGKRYLNPLLGRWCSPDPLALHDVGKADLNLYAYVQGMALKAIDALGLEDQIPVQQCFADKATQAQADQRAQAEQLKSQADATSSLDSQPKLEGETPSPRPALLPSRGSHGDVVTSGWVAGATYGVMSLVRSPEVAAQFAVQAELVSRVVGSVGAAQVLASAPGVALERNTTEFKETMSAIESAIKGTEATAGWPPNRGFVRGKDSLESLAPGTGLSRYGAERKGFFASPEGTPFRGRGLPEEYETSQEHNKYEIVTPMLVRSGPAAAAFKDPGGQTQFELPVSVKTAKGLGWIKDK